MRFMDSSTDQLLTGGSGWTRPEGLPREVESAGAALPVVIAAWLRVDPAQAARLVKGWLGTMDEKGEVTPACPVVCQWAERVADALPDAEPFLTEVMPGLARYIQRVFERFDADETGLPRWPSAEAALFPAEYVPGRFTVDLAGLLSNEAESFRRLAQGREEWEAAIGVAEGEQRELEGWLTDTFWDEESSMFHRLDPGRGSEPDGSPCGLVPLAWGGCREDMAESLRMRATGWEGAAWSPQGWILLFVLLLPTPHHSVVARMRRRGLPAGATAVEAAAWAVLTTGEDAAREAYRRELPAGVRWLDAHGRVLARALVAAGAIWTVVLLGWWIVHRESGSGTDLGELERRAYQAGAEGEHARAAVLYGQAGRQGRPVYFHYRQANEWMQMGQYDAAESAYRAILEEEPDAPNVRLNLALAVLGLGRREEALTLYRAFAEAEDSKRHPELRARARLATELIERQMALDRE